MNKMDEMVLAVPRTYLFNNEQDVFQGILLGKEKVVELVERMGTCLEVRRGDVEDDENYKQVIPYIVLVKNSDIFTYRRLTGGGEARLHNQMSIGLGGHMNVSGAENWADELTTNAIRELDEELDIQNVKDVKLNMIGVINDDAGEAGLYHVGVLFVVNINDDAEVSVRETDQIEGRWFTIKELSIPEVFEGLESWSKMAFAGVVRNERKQSITLT